MAHSNQVRELLISDNGLDLEPVFVIGDRVVTGSARLVHEARAAAGDELQRMDQAQRRRVLQSKRQAIEAQIAALNAQLVEAASNDETATIRERLQAEVHQRSPRVAASSGRRARAVRKEST